MGNCVNGKSIHHTEIQQGMVQGPGFLPHLENDDRMESGDYADAPTRIGMGRSQIGRLVD